MRSFRFTQVNSQPYSGLDGTIEMGNGGNQILLLSADGLGAPELETQNQRAPFQHGESVIRNLYRSRTITLECAITIPGNSPANMALISAKKRAISHALSPVGMGYFQNTSSTTSDYSNFLGKLAYASDGITYDRFIDCVPITLDIPNKFHDDGFQYFRVVFLCPDAFWYGDTTVQTMVPPVPMPLGTYSDPVYSSALGYSLVCDTATGKIYRSYDAITYNLISTIAGTISNLTWDAYKLKWFATGSSGCFSSSDAIAWTQVDANPMGFGVASQSCTLTFPPVGTYSTTYYCSTDGTTFTAKTLPASVTIVSAVYAEGINAIVVVGNDAGSNPKVYVSYDGYYWYTGTFAALAAVPTDIVFAESLDKFVTFFGANLQYSSDGIVWSGPVALGDTYSRPAWSNSLGILTAVLESVSGLKLIWTTNLTSITTVSLTFSASGPMTYFSGLGIFSAFSASGGKFPALSYDGKKLYSVSATDTGAIISSPLSIAAGTTVTSGGPVSVQTTVTVTVASTGVWIVSPAGSDYVAQIDNTGDAQIDFAIRIPVIGNETGKSLVLSDNFIWDGVGTPPSDRNLVISTTGVGPGFVDVNTAFGNKDIKQYGASIINKLTSGTFFQLYVSGNVTNNLYVRNTGIVAGAPVVTWRKKYVGV